MRKFLAVSAAVVSLSVGGLAVAAINPFSGAGATTPSPSTTTPASGSAAPAPRPRPGVALLKSVLSDLVAKGTITQSQSDAITAALKSKVEAFHASHPNAGQGRPGRPGRQAVLRAGLDVAAKTIGVTQADLVTALKGGQSIADVATAKGVAPQKVVDALVAAAKVKIDAAVKAGKLTADRAAKLEANLADRMTKAVNRKRHAR